MLTLLATFGFTPNCEISIDTTFEWPPIAANCKGVFPLWNNNNMKNGLSYDIVK